MEHEITEAIKIHCQINHDPKDAQKLEDRLKGIEGKLDQLLEIYTAASLMKKFFIGLIGVCGSLTALIWAWLNIKEKLNK